MKLRAKLGYTAAGMTVFAALLVPFLLCGLFTKGFASLGLHVDEMYSGGPKLRTVQTAGYTIDVHRPVFPHLLQSEKPLVQLDWKPAVVVVESDPLDHSGEFLGRRSAHRGRGFIGGFIFPRTPRNLPRFGRRALPVVRLRGVSRDAGHLVVALPTFSDTPPIVPR